MAVQFLSTAAVSGIAIAAVVGGVVLYVCGLLTGLLIAWWRRRPRKSSSMAGDASASGDPGVVYDDVLPPKPAASIPMQENVSYGPLS